MNDITPYAILMGFIAGYIIRAFHEKLKKASGKRNHHS